MLPVTRALQAVDCDLHKAMNMVSDLLDSLKEMRNEDAFSTLFQEATALAEMLGIDLSKPRTAKRSVFRPAATSCGDDVPGYYRINFYYPAIDTIANDVAHRFGDEQKRAVSQAALIPSTMRQGQAVWSQLEPGV